MCHDVPNIHVICFGQTEAVKPVLGEYYREPDKSQPFPAHLWKILLKSLSEDHFVSDDGDVVFYQRDSKHSIV
mgnify:CR=1 FL=1